MAGQQCQVCGGTTEGDDCCCRTLVRPYVGDESAEPAPAPPGADSRSIRDGLPRPLVDSDQETAGRGDAEAAGWIFADFGSSPADGEELLTRVLAAEPVSRVVPGDEILAPPLPHQTLRERWTGLPHPWRAAVIAGAALLLFGAGAAATYRWGFETAVATGYGRSRAPVAAPPPPATVTATARSTATATATVTASPKTTPVEHTSVRHTPPPGPTRTRPEAPPQPPHPYCTMDYSVVDQWSDGFEVNVAVDYRGSQSLDDWNVSWDFPSGQRIEQIWDAQATQAGPAVNVTNAPYNGSVRENDTIEFGFVGSWYGANEVPGKATLNGTPCAVN